MEKLNMDYPRKKIRKEPSSQNRNSKSKVLKKLGEVLKKNFSSF